MYIYVIINYKYGYILSFLSNKLNGITKMKPNTIILLVEDSEEYRKKYSKRCSEKGFEESKAGLELMFRQMKGGNN